MKKILKAIINLISKLKCYSKCCCGSECMLNQEQNISDNNIDNVVAETN